MGVIFNRNNDVFIKFQIPEQVQLNLKKLITKHADGIWGSSLLDEYSKLFNDELLYRHYGYGSVLHMCKEIDYIFSVVKHFKGDFKLFSADSNIPETLTVTIPRFRHDVVQGHTIIPRLQLDTTKDKITVKVCHVYDLTKFWFHTSDIEKKLSDLTKQMNEFYSSSTKYYQIATYNMRKGLYCAVLYGKQFHRCIIVDMLPELTDSVKVFFIDNGKTDYVNVKNIHFLHELFQEPNAMALRGNLTQVKPVGLNMPWPPEAVKVFEYLVMQKSLQAIVTETKEVESGEYEYSLDLSDRSTEKCVCIHEELINAGLAIDINQKQDEAKSNEYFAHNDKMMHLVPSFEELESGCVPNREDLNILYQMKYPLHQIMQKFILH